MKPPFDLLPPLLEGLAVTVGLTACAGTLAVGAALAAGLALISEHRAVRACARTYVEVFRGTSALVQLFWVFFALPLVGIEFAPFTAGVLVLGLNTGAYGAEVVRGAVQATARGQWDAAMALGLGRGQVLLRVILPQAAPAMLPPAGNLLIELLKATALVSLITIDDLVFQGQMLRAATLRSAEIYIWILLLYFAVAEAIARTIRYAEHRVGRGWRSVPEVAT